MAALWKNRVLYIMLIPLIAWYVIFKYIPMYGAIIAFKDYNILSGIGGSDWAHPWYKYFNMFYSSPYFSRLFGNTLLISCYKLIFGMVPSILLAILLNESRSLLLKRWIQTLSYMPHFLSWVIVYGIAVAFFSETNGLVNRWISDLGYNAISFLGEPEWFRSVLIGTDIWKDLGWGAIIYIAAIAGIDPSLYEAAMMDGAGRLRRIWSITLPGISNVIMLLLILKLGYILDAGFDQVFIFYNIRVYAVGDIIDTWVYRTGLEQLNFSLASAVGLFKSVIGLVLVLSANKIARRWGGGIW